jgi:chromosome segregation ATPase
MIAIDGHQILAALQQEASACRQLASLRDQQRRLIDAGEAEKLLEVLAQKQRAISRISELEEQLKPLKASWNDCCDQLPALERARIGEAFGKVRDLLAELIARETEDAEALANRKETAEQELATFDRKRQLATAYGAAGPRSDSQLVDRTDV